MKIKTELLKEWELNKEYFEDLSKDEYEALKIDVKENGITNDLHILNDYTVICGNQRLRVAKELNLPEIPVKIIDIQDPRLVKMYAIKDNLLRRQLTPEQKAKPVKAFASLKEEIRNEKWGNNQYTEDKDRLSYSSNEKDKVEQSRDIVAKDLGMSGRTMDRLIQFANIVEKAPELKNKGYTNVINNYEIKENKVVRKNVRIDLNIELVSRYDENLFYLTHNKNNSEEFNKLLEEAKEKNLLVYNGARLELCSFKEIPTLTTMGEIFYSSGKEFNLREYAEVQNFPRDYKFVGNKGDIKTQIGDAVSPKMSEYIIKKYIKGNTYIELFCGCGGFSCGARALNKKCLWAIDFEKNAGYSFKMNNPETEVYIGDILECDEKIIHENIKDVDFIIGGVPCQGFSSVGKQLGFKEDSRNQLYLEYLRFVKEFKPKQFIIENVKEILDYEEEIIQDFENIGYEVLTELVNGLDIGMKQARKRAFFIGTRKN